MQTKLASESQARQDLAGDISLRMQTFEMELSRISHNNYADSVEREANLSMRATEIKEAILAELRPALKNDVAIQGLEAELYRHQAMFESFTSELASLATKVGSGPINALGLLEASILVQEVAQQVRKEKEDRQALEELVSRYISKGNVDLQSERVELQDLTNRVKELADDNSALRESMRDNVMSILVPVMSELDVLRSNLLSSVQANDASKSDCLAQELAQQIASGKAEKDIIAAQVHADVRQGDAGINSSLHEEMQARCFHDAEIERRLQAGLAEVRKWVVQELSLGGDGIEVKTQLAQMEEQFRGAVLELLAKIQAIENQNSSPNQIDASEKTVIGAYFGSWTG